MALETATYINQLDAANPLGSDPISSGDDHLRLIKSTLKATFPNITGAVTVTQGDLNSKVPNAVQKDGSVAMTGPLTLSGNASSSLHAAPLQQVTALVQAMYPVGSVYINATNSTNPATLLGFGTWVAFGAGRVPVGFDAGNSLFNAAEKTGGSADAIVVSHTHTFSATTSTAGDHTHSISLPFVTTNQKYSGGGQGFFGEGTGTYTTAGAGSHNHTVSGTTDANGSSGTNANLPPFITVYMWKRTA